MTQSLVSIAIFLGLLACLPMAVKWLKTRSGYTPLPVGDQAVVVSAVAVGPHQRVVTVEVGPQDARVRIERRVRLAAAALGRAPPLSGSGSSSSSLCSCNSASSECSGGRALSELAASAARASTSEESAWMSCDSSLSRDTAGVAEIA